MKAALLALVLLVGGGASFPSHAPVRVWDHPATLVIALTDGLCSGTAVGPQVIATAAHCFEGGEIQAIGKERCQMVGEPVLDGNDHALVRVTCKFSRWATFGGPMRKGMDVHWWGYPGGMPDLYRRGYVMGMVEGWWLTDALVFRGDSGSGIFDRSGHLVGIVSTMFSLGESFHGMGAKPLAYTKAQLASVGL